MWRKYDAYLVGYYGMQNSGDDALLLATLYGAETQLGCNNFAVATASDFDCNMYLHAKATLTYPQQFKGQNRLQHYYHAARSKRIIFGGGSVLHNSHDINLKRKLLSLSNAKESLALGVSIGPFADNEAEQACAKFLNEIGFVGVRDRHSLDIAKRIAPDANVDLTFDLAPVLRTHANFKLANEERKGIVFNMCPVALDAHGRTNAEAETRRITHICQVIYRIWEETGEPITLLNMNKQANSDCDISAAICHTLHNKVPIETIPYTSNVFDLIEDLSRFKAAVGMRLHTNILAYMANTPTISINYHDKCREWCQQIGLPDEYRFEADKFLPQDLAEILIHGVKKGFEVPLLPLFAGVRLSQNNWRFTYEQAKNISGHPTLQQGESHLRHTEKRL